MAEENFDIDIRTRADASGARRVEDAMERVTESANDATAALSGGDAQRAATALDDVGDAARDLRTELDGVGEEAQAADPRLVQLGASLSQVESSAAAAAVQTRNMDAAGNRGAKGTRNLGQAGLEASRAFEDLQFGIGGLINNVPGLVTALGGTAGIAGAASVSVVALFQLGKALTAREQEARKLADAEREVTAAAIEAFTELSKIDAQLDFEKTIRALGEIESLQQLVAESAQLRIDLAEREEAAALRVAAAQREQAAAQLSLQEAVGAITPEEAAARRAAIEEEARLAELGATRSGLERDVARATAAREAAQERLNEALRQQTELERQLRENQTNRREQQQLARLRGIFTTDGQFDRGAADAAQLAIGQPVTSELEQRVARQEAIEEALRQEIAKIAETISQRETELNRSQVLLENTRRVAETEGAALEQVAEVEQQIARNAALTATAQEAQLAAVDQLTAVVQQVEASGQQLTRLQQEDLASLRQIVEDGQVTAGEASQAQGAVVRLLQAIGASNEQVSTTINELLGLVTQFNAVLRRQQQQINALREATPR